MAALPSGTVTFLFTDVEGSTRLLAELGAERYADVLAEHRRVLRAAFAAHGGVEVSTEGDSFFAVFAHAGDAVAAAVQARDELAGAILVRMGLHTGEPLLVDGDYVGMDVHRAARIAGVAHGGQILVSQSTRERVSETEFRDLGEHRLKDLTRAERIWQLGDGEFPPLKSLHRMRLPIAASPLIGRTEELGRIAAELRGGTTLLTVTGAGGSGKTRLALQAAAELTEAFVGGTYFVPLAPLSEATAVPSAVARALELQPDDDVAERLRASRSLLVLDNAEHLPGVEHEIAQLRIGETALLVTSRAPLNLSGEHELPLDPLPEADAAALIVARAADHGRAVADDDTVRAICRRLDNLPLALELAAARLSVLSPEALLGRLDRALPLLTGGPHDRDERQRTLRATIEWSDRLLTDDTRHAFHRLAVFRGGFTLEAAEAVAGAGLEVVTELVEGSLLERMSDDDRFELLETIREFGIERGGREAAPAHAQYYLDHVRANRTEVRGPRMNEFLAWYRAESENLWSALDELLFGGREDDAWELAVHLSIYWIGTGSIGPGVAWLQRARRRSTSPTPARTRALLRLAGLLQMRGAVREALQALEEAEPLALAAGDARDLFDLYATHVDIALAARELEAAVAHARKALEYAHKVDERAKLFALAGLAGALAEVGELEEADALLEPVPDALAAMGDALNEGGALLMLADVAFQRGRYDAARAYLDRALERARVADARPAVSLALTAQGFHAFALGLRGEAQLAFAEALRIALEHDDERTLLELVDHIAVWSADVDRTTAARLYSTVGARRNACGLPRFERDLPVYERALGGEELVGEILSWDDALELAQSLVERNLD